MLAVRHVRVLESALFIGRVYQHDAYMYEKADEDCTNMHPTSTQQKARSAFVCAQKTYHAFVNANDHQEGVIMMEFMTWGRRGEVVEDIHDTGLGEVDEQSRLLARSHGKHINVSISCISECKQPSRERDHH